MPLSKHLIRAYAIAGARATRHEFFGSALGVVVLVLFLLGLPALVDMALGPGLVGLALGEEHYGVFVMLAGLQFHVGMAFFSPAFLVQTLAGKRDPFLQHPGLKVRVASFKVLAGVFAVTAGYLILVEFFFLGRQLAGQGSGYGEAFLLFAVISILVSFFLFAVQLPMLGHLLTGSKGPAVSKAVYRLGLMVGGLSIVSFVGLVWAFKNAHEIAGYVTSLENRWSLSALIPAAAVVDAAYALRLPVLGLWAVGIVLGTVFGYFLFNVWCSTHLPRLLGQRDGGPGVAKMNRHRFEEFFVLRHAWASVWLKDFLQTARLRADLIWLWLLSVSVAGVASAWIVAGSIRSEVISAAVGGMVVKSGLLVILLVLAVRTGAGSLGQERKTATLLRMSPVGVRLPIIKALNNLAAMTITYFVFVTTALVAFSYLGVYGVLNANDLVAVYLAAAFSVLASVSAGFLYPDFSCKNVFLPGGKLLGAWVAAVVAAPVMVLGSLPATGGLPRAGVLVSLLGLGVVILNMLGHRWRYVEVP